MINKPAIPECSLGNMEPDNKNLIGPQLAKVTNRLRRYIDNEMKIFDLSRTQWQVLCTLRNMGSCSQKDLLGRLDIDAAHLARVLDKLENRQYITRDKLDQDRRALFIKMTPLAIEQLVPHLTQVHIKEHEVLLRGLTTTETQQLSQLLNKLENNLDITLLQTTKDQVNE
jgi:DNA-binding MarR family transcriptional regulator